MAFLSIGVDYFQVLAIFRRSKVSWPDEIREIFRILSLFNFNLDITAPECAIPNLDYDAKWGFVQSLPLGAGAILLLLHFVQWFRKRCILNRKGKGNHDHVHVLISTALVLFYYMYLYLLRMQLEVFNCLPTDPPDGHTYADFVSPTCGGLCRCDEDGGLHSIMMPRAVAAFFAYSLGFPLVVGFLMWRYRMHMQADQLFRALEAPDKESVIGKNVYVVRQRFHKLYYHFKPDYYFWLLLILMRKFMIAFTSLMFNRNPSFQMSIALLVMFGCFALQVKYEPYMSNVEMEDVAWDHREKAKDPDNVMHATVAATLKQRGKVGGRRGAKHNMDAVRDSTLKRRQTAQSFFWNYVRAAPRSAPRWPVLTTDVTHTSRWAPWTRRTRWRPCCSDAASSSTWRASCSRAGSSSPRSTLRSARS